MFHPRRLWLATLLGSASFIGCSHKPSDDLIAMHIKANLFSDPTLKSANLFVAVSKGVVTLGGSVTSSDEELKAYKIALATEGVRNVSDKISIDLPVVREQPFSPPPEAYKVEYPSPTQPEPAKNNPPPTPASPPPPAQIVHDFVPVGIPVPVPVAVAPAYRSPDYLSDPPDIGPLYSAPGILPDSIATPRLRAKDNRVSLAGAGTASPLTLYRRWFATLRQIGGPEADYRAIGSRGGFKLITEGAVDFGASDTPLTDEQLSTFRSTYGYNLVAVPTVIGAVVPSYNIPGVVADLNFTPEILAAIYLGKITRWNDPLIATLNVGANLPNLNITVIHRSEDSGATYCWTDYLSKVSPDWQLRVGRNSLVEWPIGIGAHGNEGVVESLRQQRGSIAYVDLSYALRMNLLYGRVQNSAQHLVKANLESLTAAAAGRPTYSDVGVSITNAPGQGAYPISSFTWLLVPQTAKDSSKAAAMKELLRWILRDGQWQAESLSYARLPASMIASDERQIRMLR